MTDPPHTIREMGELDALYGKFYMEYSDGEGHYTEAAYDFLEHETGIPLNLRVHLLRSEGNWPQAKVCDKLTSATAAVLTQSHRNGD